MPSEWANRGAKRAREARAALAHGDRPPDVLEAVERAGAHVVLLELDPRIAGAYVPRVPLVVVNGRQPLVRQRFTLAHELGHHRMGHGAVVDAPAAFAAHDPMGHGGRDRPLRGDGADVSATIAGDRRRNHEVAANAFAAELLLPRAVVAAWGERGAVTLEHVVALAREHGVSAQAARYALAGAGVLRDPARERALDQEIADGLHVELSRWLGLEPLADGLADAAAALPRIPRALRGTALGDYLAGAISMDALARGLGAQPDAVREMLHALALDRLVPG